MLQKPKASHGIPLRLVLIAPFVVQIIAAVGITGWVSYDNGQRSAKYLFQETKDFARVNEPLCMEFSIQNERHFFRFCPSRFIKIWTG